MNDGKRLRIINYMPDYPIELFQMYQHYLEEVLGKKSFLIVESRQCRSDMTKANPFATDEVDIGFMNSTDFLRTQEYNDSYVELLPVAPIHIHPKSELKPVYFSEIVVRIEKEEKYKFFKDLIGHTWAYNDKNSVSGSISTLAELKTLGSNSSFFSNKIQTGSHQNSLTYLLENKADVASIDSNVLGYYLNEHPEYRKKLHVLCSIGPLPISPIVVNSRMSKDLKDLIVQAFLNMNKSVKWQNELSNYKVWGFKAINRSLYESEEEIHDKIRGESLHMAYY